MKRTLAAGAATILVTGFLLWAGTIGAAAATTGLLRIAYLAPGAPAADLYLDGTLSTSNAAYKTVTTYIPVTPGAHTVAVRQAGAAASAAATAQTSVNVGAGQRWTVIVGGQWSSLQASGFQDDTATPPSGDAEVRFIHTALQVPGVDVAVKGGPVVFHDISFMQASPYTSESAGAYVLQLKATGTRTVLFTAPQVTVTSGQISTLVGVGGVGAPVQLLALDDAAAPGSAPTGGADAGGGGMSATVREAEALAALLMLALGGLAVVAFREARRRQATGAGV